jgi:hypothetical protein
MSTSKAHGCVSKGWKVAEGMSTAVQRHHRLSSIFQSELGADRMHDEEDGSHFTRSRINIHVERLCFICMSIRACEHADNEVFIPKHAL